MSNSNDGRFISPIKSLRAVQERLTEAVLARHVFNHPQLVSEVRRLLSGSDPNSGALAQQPILEAIFPYFQESKPLTNYPEILSTRRLLMRCQLLRQSVSMCSQGVWSHTVIKSSLGPC